ncbi:unnamed protein product [Rotaria socialis]|uniref:Uncharacterized protein n=1 Tax=Rotaria socialis TaxID=392032 RepID=A0A820TMP0_9BILA|nr:unnamed protein product [Rotaria socialis]
MNKIIIILTIYLTHISIVGSHWFWSSDEEQQEASKPPRSPKDLAPVIGIDLGTTYSCVAIFKSCHAEVIENDQGNRITPSYVTFTPNGERYIGDAAKNLLTSNPQNTIFHMKRLIGRNFDDPSIQKDLKYFPFSVFRKDDKPVVKVKTASGDKLFTPEEISAMVLGKMREIAETYLGKKVKNAVVTVPAYFNDVQRQATKDAGTIAGLNVVRIINEPTAAAIAYGLDRLRKEEGSKNILVFDLGGGTFDVSLLTFEDGTFQVLATNGDTHLGGEDFDLRVMEYFIHLFEEKTNKDVRGDVRALQKLRREVEKAKRTLSTEIETKIEIESFFPNEDFHEKLTRAKFEDLNMDLFRSTLKPVQNVLQDAGLKNADIDEIILVGGSTKIPMIRKIIREYFNGKAPSHNINPDEVVGEQKLNENKEILYLYPDYNFVFVTAYGAAIQGAILSKEECTQDIGLLDICPLTMGIETKGGVLSTIIPKNTVIPAIKTEDFTTTVDHQTSVSIQVFEGERSMAKENHFLGDFELTGIPPAPRGQAKIAVTFHIDVNGILEVTAEDKDGRNKKTIVINTDKNRLSSNEIDRMIKEAEKFAEQDKQFRDQINARNNLESYVYFVKNRVANNKELSDKLSSADKKTLESSIEDQTKWLELNPDAKIGQLRVHLKQFQDIVKPIMDKLLIDTENLGGNLRSSNQSHGDFETMGAIISKTKNILLEQNRNNIWYAVLLGSGALIIISASMARISKKILQKNHNCAFFADRSISFLSSHRPLSASTEQIGYASIDEFREKVPLTTFDEYRSYIDRMMSGGEKNVLTSARLIYFATSSGTTGNIKLIPVVETYFENISKLPLVAFAAIWRSLSPTFFPSPEQRAFHLQGGKRAELFQKSQDDIPIGPLTQITSAISLFSRMRNLSSILYITPLSLIEQIPNFDTSTFIQLTFALAVPDVSIYTILFAPGFIHTLKMIENQYEEICHCISSANFNHSTLVRNNISDTKLIAILNRTLDEIAIEYGGWPYRLQRSAYIRTQCQQLDLPGILPRLWPNLKFVSTATGGSFSIYKQRIQHYCGENIPLINLPLYVASEGLLGTLASIHTDEYFLFPTSVFFEFIREEDSHQTQPKTLLLSELEPGNRYELVCTSEAGFVRYRMGDIITCTRFLSRANDIVPLPLDPVEVPPIPLVSITYRLGSILDVYGEKTSEQHIMNALNRAMDRWRERKISIDLRDFTSCPKLDEFPSRYVIFLEFMDEGNELDHQKLLQLQDVVDTDVEQELCEVNPLYKDYRNSNRLGPIICILVESGTFAAFLHDKLINDRVSPVQIKPHRMLTNEQHIQFFYDNQISNFN